MKARVKATGQIVEIVYTFKTVGSNPIDKFETAKGKRYDEEELDFNIDTPDYWTRLEHQAAIAAMQGLITRGEVLGSSVQEIARDIAEISCEVAHALVEKYKKEESK